MPKLPSPCIDVCKFKREGHCIACSMTKPQKALFKALDKDKHRKTFVELIAAQQNAMGKYPAWRALYDKKLRKKGIDPFL